MRVFISYVEQDEKLASSLRKRLRLAGHEVFDPAVDLYPGDNWLAKTGEALETSEAVIFLLSPRATKSPWVQKEIEFALSGSKFKGRLLPVIFSSATHSAPWILKKLNHMELSPKVSSNSEKAAQSIVDTFSASVA
jgi:hypothetical protein